MPNWCYNQTIFYGDEETVQKIYKGLEETVDLIKDNHIDKFFRLLGVPQEELDTTYNTRAFICDFDINKEENALILSYESAWNPIIEDLDAILIKYQPNLKQVTWAEECGCGIYINTDREGLYFTDRYYLDMSTEGGNDFNDNKYFNCLEDAIKAFKEFYEVNTEITTEEELRKEISKVRDRYDDDVYITFDEFTDY